MFARHHNTTTLFSRLRSALSVLQPVRRAICSAVSTRGQSRPLALEQCGYERGYTQIEKKPLKSRQQGRSVPTSKKLDLNCTKHVSQQRHSTSDGIHSFPYLHRTKSRKRQADEGTKHTNTDHPTNTAADTASNPKGDKLTKAKHTNPDLPTIIAADTA